MTVVRVIYTGSGQEEVERILTELGFGDYEILHKDIPAYKHRLPIEDPERGVNGVASISVSTCRPSEGNNIATEITKTKILFENSSSDSEKEGFSEFGKRMYDGLLSQLRDVIVTNSTDTYFY